MAIPSLPFPGASVGERSLSKRPPSLVVVVTKKKKKKKKKKMMMMMMNSAGVVVVVGVVVVWARGEAMLVEIDKGYRPRGHERNEAQLRQGGEGVRG